MRQNPWIFISAALGALVLTSCGDQPNQPETPVVSDIVAPIQLTAASDTWERKG
jgi:hypothetical protein